MSKVAKAASRAPNLLLASVTAVVVGVCTKCQEASWCRRWKVIHTHQRCPNQNCTCCLFHRPFNLVGHSRQHLGSSSDALGDRGATRDGCGLASRDDACLLDGQHLRPKLHADVRVKVLGLSLHTRAMVQTHGQRSRGHTTRHKHQTTRLALLRWEHDRHSRGNDCHKRRDTSGHRQRATYTAEMMLYQRTQRPFTRCRHTSTQPQNDRRTQMLLLRYRDRRSSNKDATRATRDDVSSNGASRHGRVLPPAALCTPASGYLDEVVVQSASLVNTPQRVRRHFYTDEGTHGFAEQPLPLYVGQPHSPSAGQRSAHRGNNNGDSKTNSHAHTRTEPTRRRSWQHRAINYADIHTESLRN